METLYVVACVANPLRWRSRVALARAAVGDWLKEPNVHITLAECAYGSRGYDLADLASDRVDAYRASRHDDGVGKENLHQHRDRAPAAGRARRSPSSTPTSPSAAPAGRPTRWPRSISIRSSSRGDTAYDLGPNDEHISVHKSFACGLARRQAGRRRRANFWRSDGGPYDYPHPGYAWGWQRRTLDRIGGLFELGGMGSGDHHMALGHGRRYEASLPAGVTAAYTNAVAAWSGRAAAEINGKLGFVHGTIEHPFHGRKSDRGYQSRWAMFLDTASTRSPTSSATPDGVIEFAGNKPDLERAFDRYLRSRDEDVNTLT